MGGLIDPGEKGACAVQLSPKLYREGSGKLMKGSGYVTTPLPHIYLYKGGGSEVMRPHKEIGDAPDRLRRVQILLMSE